MAPVSLTRKESEARNHQFLELGWFQSLYMFAFIPDWGELFQVAIGPGKGRRLHSSLSVGKIKISIFFGDGLTPVTT